MAHFLTTGAPKTDPSQDDLERKEFSREIARTLVSWKNSETLVVSLSGEWGVGKTTIANFIKYYLREIDPECLFVDFNPWEWSGQHKVFEGFFWQIGSLFGKKDRSKQMRRLRKKWRNMASVLQGLKIVSEEAPHWVSILLNLLTAAGVVGALTLGPVWLRAGSLVVAALSTLSLLSSLPKKIGEILSPYEGVEPLEDLRDEIAEELRVLKKPIIVFIDDIDRLTRDEIALVFQLVKSNVRLPNMVFFLMFQKSIVTDALSTLTSEDGEKYLRKIVQVEWETPMPSEAVLMTKLNEGINKIVNDGNPRIEWDAARWRTIFAEGIWPYFRTLRDVNRFLASYEFNFRVQLNGNVLEVNAVDLTAMEVLRTFENGVYLTIARAVNWNDDLETRISWRGTKALDELLAKFNGIIDHFGRTEEGKTRLRTILQNLFPAPFGGHADKDENFRSMRICSATHFSKYFRGTVDIKNQFAARWAKLLEISHDRSAVRVLVEEAIKENRLHEILMQLWSGRDQVPLSSVTSMATALFDVGDNFPSSAVGPGLFDPFMTVTRFVHHRLVQEDLVERTRIIKKILADTTGFYLPLDLIGYEDSSTRKRRPELAYLLPEAEVPWLEAHGLNLIRRRAKDGLLLKEDNEAPILSAWLNWAPHGEVRKWVEGFLTTPSNALHFLKAVCGKSYSGSKNFEPFLNGKYIEEFVEMERLEALIAQAPDVQLSEMDRRYKQILLAGVALKKEGKSYENLQFEGQRVRQLKLNAQELSVSNES